MKRILISLMFACLSVVVNAAGLGAEASGVERPVVATLTLPHATVLPGVPFDIVVTLKNVSDRRATVGLIANLVATLPDGSTFVSDGPNDHWLLEPNDTSGEPVTSVELAPGESVQRVASWDRGSIPNWSRHESFTGPGSYEIALDLARGYRDQQMSDHVNYVGAVRTSSALLERVVPLGEDEVLWQRMHGVAGRPWSDSAFVATKAGMALAKDIVQLHPTSGYYPYALLLRKFTRNKEDIPLFLEAAERFHDSPAFPYLVKAAGDAAFYEGTTADWERHDMASAKRFYDLAETYYRDALKTNSLAIRGGAERSLEDIESRRSKLRVVQER